MIKSMISCQLLLPVLQHLCVVCGTSEPGKQTGKKRRPPPWNTGESFVCRQEVLLVLLACDWSLVVSKPSKRTPTTTTTTSLLELKWERQLLILWPLELFPTNLKLKPTLYPFLSALFLVLSLSLSLFLLTTCQRRNAIFSTSNSNWPHTRHYDDDDVQVVASTTTQ